MSGTFIVLEGPDGSGTSLHSRLLAENLRSNGHDVLLTAEPTHGPIGSFVRSALHNSHSLSPTALQSLFTADRAWHIENEIKPALITGKTVVCDRYIPSTLIYGTSMDLPLEWLENMNQYFVQQDHLVITLPPYEVCRERINRRPEHDVLEGEELQQKVYEAYRVFAEKYPDALTIDTSGDKKEVAEKIRAFIEG